MTQLAETLREWFGTTPAAGRIAARLYEAAGQVVAHATLMEVSGQTANGVNLSIKFLRMAMEPGAIANHLRVGFCMTAAGLADCDRAIADAAERARAA